VIGYLFISGLLYALAGMYSLVAPNEALGILGIHIDGINGLSQERGTAGGVTLAIGVLLIASAHYRKLVIPALWATTVVLCGLEFGRLISIVVDGMPRNPIWIYMGLEVAGLLQGIYWLRMQTALDAESA
jgi:hypothetical protein